MHLNQDPFHYLAPTGGEVVTEAGCYTKGPGFEFRVANIRILIRTSTLGENRKRQGVWRKKEFHACAMQRFRYYTIQSK